MRRAALLLAMLAGGCTHAQVADWAHGRYPRCNLPPIREEVGALATHGRVKRMTRISRATDVRVIRPGLWHGADVVPTRLSVTVDASNRITAIACG